jgi:hypothetical protein
MTDARNHEVGRTQMHLSIEMVCGGLTAVQNNMQLLMKPFHFVECKMVT